jgi:hypothetical protein
MRSPNNPFKFQTLLGTLVLLLFLPAISNSEWVSVISRSLYTVVMLASLYLVAANRKELLIGVLLFIPVTSSNWLLDPFVTLQVQLVVYCIFQVVFLSYVMHKVLKFLIEARKVDPEIIYAAIILYFIFAVCLSLVYFGILIVIPGSFGEDLVPDFSDRNSLTLILHNLMYFSFVTQTTLGYGDISPTLAFSKSVVSIQAMAGQIYLAVIIARLVGMQIASQTNGKDKED